MMRVSIVVPIYNVEQYLAECVDSLIIQTYGKIEIILVDDGSTDNSGKIADEYGMKDLRIKVIHKKNGGLSDARNAGIVVARGEYIMFVDSDDYVDSRFVETALSAAQDHSADIVSFKFTAVYEDGSAKESSAKEQTDFKEYSKI